MVFILSFSGLLDHLFCLILLGGPFSLDLHVLWHPLDVPAVVVRTSWTTSTVVLGGISTGRISSARDSSVANTIGGDICS